MTALDGPVPRLPVGMRFAVASALLFGLSTPCAKLLLGETPPLLLAGPALRRRGPRNVRDPGVPAGFGRRGG